MNRLQVWLIALVLWAAAGAVFSSYSGAQTWPFVGSPGVPSSLPIIIAQAYGVQPPTFTGDMGATPDVNLIKYVMNQNDTQNSTVTANCTTPCNPVVYRDFITNFCSSTSQQTVIAWANANDENAFLHSFPGGSISSGNRMPYPNSTPSTCTALPGSPSIPAQEFNAGDPTLQAYLKADIWATAAPNLVFEDNPQSMGNYITGESSNNTQLPSLEYSCGWNGGSPCPPNIPGTSVHAQGIDWQTALGGFVNSAAGTGVGGIILNGGSPSSLLPSESCYIIVSHNCNGQFYTGLINDANGGGFVNTCTANTSLNLRGIMMENAIEHKLSAGTYPTADNQQLTAIINAASVFENSSACLGVTLIDYEYPFGNSGPAGTGYPADSIAQRTMVTAIHWLVPNPLDGIPDRMIYRYETLGSIGSTTEAPYFFEETLVPYSPETTVPAFAWNGTTVGFGDNCPNVGDTGGAAALMVACAPTSGTGAVFCQQYRHLQINGSDVGPAAACFNSSSSSIAISSSWFKHDAITTYNYTLTLATGELTSVPDKNVSGGTIALSTCTNGTYCVGSTSLSSQATSFNPASPGSLCGPCGIILLHNN